MPDIEYIRGEIERMRVQVGRQHKEILQLQRAGSSRLRPTPCLKECWPKSTPSVLTGQAQGHSARPSPAKGKVLGRSVLVGPLRWYDDGRELSPFLTALEDVRRKATREGWCYQHVQTIIVSIDQ
jgi:hypothetical protein